MIALRWQDAHPFIVLVTHNQIVCYGTSKLNTHTVLVLSVGMTEGVDGHVLDAF